MPKRGWRRFVRRETVGDVAWSVVSPLPIRTEVNWAPCAGRAPDDPTYDPAAGGASVSRSSRLRILPLAFIGMASTNSHRRGTL